MAFPQQHEVYFPGNPSHTADASWSVTDFKFPPPQHSQSAPLPYPHPLPGQLHGHAGVLQGAVMPPHWHSRGSIYLYCFSSHQWVPLVVDEQTRTGNIPPHVEVLAAQALSPHQRRCVTVLTSFYGMHIPNHTLYQTLLTHLMTKFSRH